MNKITPGTVDVNIRRIPLNIWREAKSQAAREGRQLREYVIAALAYYLSRRKNRV